MTDEHASSLQAVAYSIPQGSMDSLLFLSYLKGLPGVLTDGAGRVLPEGAG